MKKNKDKSILDYIKNNWIEIALGEIADINMGQSPPSKTYNLEGKGLPFFQGRKDFGLKYPNKTTYCTLPKKIAEKGDVLLSVRAPIGDLNISLEKCCIGRGLSSISMKNGNNEFLYYLLKHYQRMLKHIFEAEGTVFGCLTKGDLIEFSVLIPKNHLEQNRIAKILSDLDTKIKLNQQMNTTLEAIGQVLFKHWFVDFEFHDEQDNPYKSSGGEIVDSELGEIPKEWKIVKMEKIVSEKKFAIVDGPFGTQLHRDEYVNEGIPVIRISNLSFEGKFKRNSLVYISEEKFKTLIRSAIYPGDILLAKTGATIGKLSKCPKFIEKGIVASSVMKISPHLEKFNKHYLYNIIKKLSDKKYWEAISGGTTRPTISIPDVKSIKIIYPIEIIMKKYNTLVDPLYTKMESNEQEIHNLSSIRDSLLPKLMSGKIRVSLESDQNT